MFKLRIHEWMFDKDRQRGFITCPEYIDEDQFFSEAEE